MPTCDNCGIQMAYIPSSDTPYWLCSRCHATKPATKDDANKNECKIL